MKKFRFYEVQLKKISLVFVFKASVSAGAFLITLILESPVRGYVHNLI